MTCKQAARLQFFLGTAGGGDASPPIPNGVSAPGKTYKCKIKAIKIELKKKHITNINMKTLKLLIKTSFFNKINDFLCFDIIKYIFNRRSNKVFISSIIKINTLV